MATASGAANKDCKDTECSVCHEAFTDPKLLPCAHVLCRQCLVTWLSSQPRALCPLCRCSIVEQQKVAQFGAEQIANSFPNELAMGALSQADRILSQPRVCCDCEDEQAATSLCVQCGYMYCAACTKLHQKQKATKKHRVEDLSSLTAQKLAVQRPSPCSLHADEAPKLFCRSHEEAICHVCAPSRHRSCPGILDLERKMQESRTELTKVKATLTAGVSRMDHAVQMLDTHLKQTKEMTKTLLEEIDTVCNSLEVAVNARRQELKQLVLSTQEDDSKAVKKTKTCLLQRRARLASHSSVVGRVVDVDGHDIMPIMASLMSTRIQDLNFSVNLPDTARPICSPSLVIRNYEIPGIECNLSQLGQMKTTLADLPVQASQWRFHHNHAVNIILTNNFKTAEKMRMLFGERVVGCQCMEPNTLYQVRVDCIPSESIEGRRFLLIGVTTAVPDKITASNDGWVKNVVIDVDRVSTYLVPLSEYVTELTQPGTSQDSKWHHGTRLTRWRPLSQAASRKGSPVESGIGRDLRYLHTNKVVGLLIDNKRSLHLYIDYRDLGVAATNLHHPCFPLVDLKQQGVKVTTLPLEYIKPNE